MATPAFAVRIQLKSVPFLTQAPGNTLDNVRGYIASLEGWLWGKGNHAIETRLNAIKNDVQFKNLMKNPHGPATLALRPFMLKLDRIAYDIKEVVGNEYECTPITVNVAKPLDVSNGEGRATLQGLIAVFQENYQGDGAAGIQTVVNLPKPNSTYRIDRENLSLPPVPRYWTYRVQVVTNTYGGMLMQSNITFTLASVRAALNSSLASSAPGLAGVYIRLSAPQWLTDIVNAD